MLSWTGLTSNAIANSLKFACNSGLSDNNYCPQQLTNCFSCSGVTPTPAPPAPTPPAPTPLLPNAKCVIGDTLKCRRCDPRDEQEQFCTLHIGPDGKCYNLIDQVNAIC